MWHKLHMIWLKLYVTHIEKNLFLNFCQKWVSFIVSSIGQDIFWNIASSVANLCINKIFIWISIWYFFDFFSSSSNKIALISVMPKFMAFLKVLIDAESSDQWRTRRFSIKLSWRWRQIVTGLILNNIFEISTKVTFTVFAKQYSLYYRHQSNWVTQFKSISTNFYALSLLLPNCQKQKKHSLQLIEFNELLPLMGLWTFAVLIYTITWV